MKQAEKHVKFVTHVALFCGDLEMTATWYEEILGMEVRVSSPGRFTAMTFGYRHHDFALVQAPPNFKPPQIEQVGLYHISIDTGSFDASMQIYGAAKTKNKLDFVKAIDHRVGIGIYLRDPDGNVIELWSETYPTQEDAIAEIPHFDPPFEENPIGWPLNMDELWTDWAKEHWTEPSDA
jgi:catechol 2,3-dioxygenase